MDGFIAKHFMQIHHPHYYFIQAKQNCIRICSEPQKLQTDKTKRANSADEQAFYG